MHYELLNTTLLALNGVTKKQILKLDITRFLLHDKPFVVLQQGSKILHVKLTKGKIKEYLVRYNGIFSPSSLYNSSRWLQLELNAIDNDLLKDILTQSYKALVLECSQLSQTIYQTKIPLKYDIDANKVLKKAKPFSDLEFGKKILDI